jgi:hypothetical protein
LIFILVKQMYIEDYYICSLTRTIIIILTILESLSEVTNGADCLTLTRAVNNTRCNWDIFCVLVIHYSTTCTFYADVFCQFLKFSKIKAL